MMLDKDAMLQNSGPCQNWLWIYNGQGLTMRHIKSMYSMLAIIEATIWCKNLKFDSILKKFTGLSQEPLNQY